MITYNKGMIGLFLFTLCILMLSFCGCTKNKESITTQQPVYLQIDVIHTSGQVTSSNIVTLK